MVGTYIILIVIGLFILSFIIRSIIHGMNNDTTDDDDGGYDPHMGE